MAVTAAPYIALIGGGYTLQHVAKLLPPQSFVMTSRSSETCATWRAHGYTAHQVSLEDKRSIEDLFATYPSLRVVVDSVPPIRSSSDPALGVKNLCDVIKAAHVTRVIYLSTTGVFGGRDGRVITEETPPSPWNAQGEARWLSECAYRDHGIPMIALRLPAIYGPDRGLVHSLRQGSYRLVGKGEMWTNRIHVSDLARIIERTISVADVPPVLCVSDDCPAQAQEVAEFVCAREGLPLPGFVSEEEVLRAGAFTMLSNQRVQNALLKKVLDIKLQYPSYREGFYS